MNPKSFDWTIMIYLAADNDLTSKAWERIVETLSYERSPSVRVLLALDINRGHTTVYDLPGAAPFRTIRLDDNLNFGSTEPLTYLLNLAASDPLANDPPTESVRQKLARKTPLSTELSKKYALIVWNHGGGWDQLASDNSAEDKLTAVDLRQAIEASAFAPGAAQAKKLEFIGFDACLTSVAEVASHLEPLAKVMIASQTLAPASGWPYRQLFERLRTQPELDIKKLAPTIVADFKAKHLPPLHGTLAALDLPRVSALRDALSELAARIRRQQDWRRLLVAARQRMITLFNADYVDVASLIEQVTNELRIDAKAVSAALDACFVRNGNGNALARVGKRNEKKCGLSLYFPLVAPDKGLAPYSKLGFSEEWTSLLNELFSCGERATAV